MKLQAAILCDKATVREGLLHLLGGGITNVNRSDFPAKFACDLALLLEVEAGDTARQHRIDVTVFAEDGEEEVARGAIGMEGAGESDDDSPSTFPIVLPFSDVGLPKPGIYLLAVSLNEGEATQIRFRVTEQPSD